MQLSLLYPIPDLPPTTPRGGAKANRPAAEYGTRPPGGGVLRSLDDSGVYQDDLVTPGSSPAWAISRRQMRHRPNLR